MKFRIDDLGEGKTYIEIEEKENWLELGAGYPTSARRAFVTGINRRQALALADVLRAMAESLNP